MGCSGCSIEPKLAPDGSKLFLKPCILSNALVQDEDFNPSSSSSEANDYAASEEGNSPSSSSSGSAEVVSEDDMPTSALRKVMLEQAERPAKRKR